MSGNPRDLLYRGVDPAEAAHLASKHLPVTTMASSTFNIAYPKRSGSTTAG